MHVSCSVIVFYAPVALEHNIKHLGSLSVVCQFEMSSQLLILKT